MEIRARVYVVEKEWEGQKRIAHLQRIAFLDQDGRAMLSAKIKVPNGAGVRPGVYALNDMCWSEGEYGFGLALHRDCAQLADFVAVKFSDIQQARKAGKSLEDLIDAQVGVIDGTAANRLPAE
jgi:hypothetical protein